MNISFRLSLLACICLILSCYSCASRPDEQIKLAEDAMNQALEQFAEQYAPGEWESAKEIWDQAQQELAEERFSAAAASFTTAKARLLKATEVAKEERASMKKQVTDFQANIAASYETFKSDVSRTKLSGSAKKDYEAACADIDKRIALIATQLEQGDFIGAKENALGALQAIDYSGKKLLPGK